jgi:hypothetical protein
MVIYTTSDSAKPDDAEEPVTDTEEKPNSRRRFLGTVGGVAAAAAAVGAVGLEPILGSKRSIAHANHDDGLLGPLSPRERENRSAAIRHAAEQFDLNLPLANHPNNGDESRFDDKIGSFTKSLRHNSIGEVNHNAYNAFIRALDSSRDSDFDALVTGGHFGCPDRSRQRRLVNPQAGYAFDLEGSDAAKLSQRPAPAFSSAEEAGEMAELYWMALLRDINFNDYDTSPLAHRAADDLSGLSDFRGPKMNGRVTTGTLFRDRLPGVLNGPYVSQFLILPTGFGAQRMDMKIATVAPGVNFMTAFQSWLDVQNGCQPTDALTPAGLVYCRNGRDLGQYVHIDALHQAYFVACLNLLGGGYRWNIGNPYGQTPEPGSGLPLPAGVPGSISQVGFGTFGGPHILALMPEVSSRALKAVWFEKWFVHRRLRPEEFGGRVEVVRRRLENYPIHSDLFRSDALDAVFSLTGNYLLPMAFAEGSPIHPSYGAGHATVAGACTTILKAFFDETSEIRNPMVVSDDGQSLEPYTGPALTVGGELNKIASNVATGRNHAGVHWRSDALESLKLGEAVAISILRDQRATYDERFDGFTFTKFDGTRITV